MISETQAKRLAKMRDGCSCIICGNKGNLTQHHVYPKSKYPEWHANPNNMVTLCVKHHRLFHNEFCNTIYGANLLKLVKFMQKYGVSKSKIEKVILQVNELHIKD